MGSTFLVAEVGINHNGSLQTAMDTVRMAHSAGFDAVKFQKRDPEGYPERPYNSPLWGETTYRDHKRRLEFGELEYGAIDALCVSLGIRWFVSCFDVPSVEFMDSFSPRLWKIPSPAMLDVGVVCEVARRGGEVLMSTGMSELWELDRAVEAFLSMPGRGRLTLLHCCSEYPCPKEHANLLNMSMLRARYGLPVGYSSHDGGVTVPLASVALGASCVEVHVTLGRSMRGSDHASSLGPSEMSEFVARAREVECALGDEEKHVYDGERAIRRKVTTL
jgi:N-acetylneuraminate synthase